MSAVDSSYFELEESGTTAIVRMTVGTIRHPAQASEFSADLAELVETFKRTHIVINFHATHYFCSSAFGALFSLSKRLNDAGGKLVLCALNTDLLVGANILGLGTVATFCESEAEALNAVV